MHEKPKLSFVIPVFNEESNLAQLYVRLKAVLDEQKLAYEIILVDDGSSDNSLLEMQKLHDQE